MLPAVTVVFALWNLGLHKKSRPFTHTAALLKQYGGWRDRYLWSLISQRALWRRCPVEAPYIKSPHLPHMAEVHTQHWLENVMGDVMTGFHEETKSYCVCPFIHLLQQSFVELRVRSVLLMTVVALCSVQQLSRQLCRQIGDICSEINSQLSTFQEMKMPILARWHNAFLTMRKEVEAGNLQSRSQTKETRFEPESGGIKIKPNRIIHILSINDQ